jgi:hypothetical protein
VLRLLRSAWHPDSFQPRNDNPCPVTWHTSTEEILDRLAVWLPGAVGGREVRGPRPLPMGVSASLMPAVETS